jgi:WD40 repeat protein
MQRHPFHEEPLTCLDVSADSSAVLTGAMDGSLMLTNVHTQRIVGTLHGERRPLRAAAPPGRMPSGRAASRPGRGCCCGTDRRPPGGSEQQQQRPPCSRAAAVASSAAAQPTARPLCPCAGHEDSVEACGFSKHLPLAASASMDGKMIIWDLGSFGQRGTCAHPEVRGRPAGWGCTLGCWHLGRWPGLPPLELLHPGLLHPGLLHPGLLAPGSLARSDAWVAGPV